ncbi:MAG: hypothetical protein IT427_14200 [Pirellulales bacterium]|nr:hypothetical protein [Pirellulales bacterium]
MRLRAIWMKFGRSSISYLLLALCIYWITQATAADGKQRSAEATTAAGNDPAKQTPKNQPAVFNPTDPAAPLKRLVPDYDVWIDSKNKQIVVDGEICLTRGLLEMFACLKGTKEHESIVTANTRAYLVHAALLAIGAHSGSPAKWDPKYVPACGTPIDITVYWTDQQGLQHHAKAQDWVRNIKTQQPLATHWVFAGSAFHHDELTGKNTYLSDASGDFICVSNFPSAMLDLPIESSQANAELAFEANTEKIPPRGTKVKLVLIPKLDKTAKEKSSGGAEIK